MENLNEILEQNNFYNFEIVSSGHENELPKTWTKLIAAGSLEEKRSIINDLWQPFAKDLQLTIALFDKLQDVVVIRENEEFKLIYFFDIDEMISVYTGRLPVDSGPFLKDLPADVATFYKTIHNGWFENISGGLGFLSLQDMDWLSEYEWGILDDIPPLDLDLSKVFHVFHNAGGGYLCFNVSDRSATESLIFWTTKEPKRNVSFWPLIDSWIEIGLTN